MIKLDAASTTISQEPVVLEALAQDIKALNWKVV